MDRVLRQTHQNTPSLMILIVLPGTHAPYSDTPLYGFLIPSSWRIPRLKCDDDNAEEENSDEKTLIADGEESEFKWQGTHGGLGDGDEDGALSFIYLAQIDWKVSRDHVIRFGDGRQVEATKFLKRDKWR